MLNILFQHVCAQTRIRGLVKGAKEVQVSLLTSTEAVDMLCLLAELSASEKLPSEIMQITRVCGNLPLLVDVQFTIFYEAATCKVHISSSWNDSRE